MEITSVEQFAQLVLDAAQSKNWWLLLALALSGAVFLLRKYGDKIPFYSKWLAPFFATPTGGAVLTLVSAFVGALATALLGGATMTGALALSALKIALTAAGGWTLLKHLWPLLGQFFPPKSAVVAVPTPAPVKAPTSDEIANK